METWLEYIGDRRNPASSDRASVLAHTAYRCLQHLGPFAPYDSRGMKLFQSGVDFIHDVVVDDTSPDEAARKHGVSRGDIPIVMGTIDHAARILTGRQTAGLYV
jgi:hypothetical protein